MLKKLPWYARNLGREALKSPLFVFNGVYSEFPSETAYDNGMWLERSRRAVKLVKSRSGAVPEPLSQSKCLLPIICAQFEYPRILDFGGGLGLDYEWLKIQGIKSDYHIVEVPALCRGKKYHKDIPDMEFDIAYSFSSIHTTDFRHVLKRFNDISPQYILLCKHPVYEGESFVRMQRGYGPQWVMNLQEIKSLLPKYALSFRALSEDNLNVDNFPPEYRVGTTTNLLFKAI